MTLLSTLLSTWVQLLPQVLVLLLFRASPFVAYVLLTRKVGLYGKLLSIRSYAALFLGLKYIQADVRGIVASGVAIRPLSASKQQQQADGLVYDTRPTIRAAALIALVRHDVDAADYWLARGSNDENGFVRLTCFKRLLDRRALNESQHRKYLADLLTFASFPPISELIRLSQIRLRNGELYEAIATLETAKRYAFSQQWGEWFTEQIRRLDKQVGK